MKILSLFRLTILTIIIKPNTSQPWMRTEWNWENIQDGTIQDTIFIFVWTIPLICCLHSPHLYIYIICKYHLSSQLEFNDLIDKELCCKHPYQITRGHTDLILIGYSHKYNPYLPQTPWVIWFWMFTVGIQHSSLKCTQTNVLWFYLWYESQKEMFRRMTSCSFPYSECCWDKNGIQIIIKLSSEVIQKSF